MNRYFIVCVIIFVVVFLSLAQLSGGAIPAGYTEVRIEGFQVLVRDKLMHQEKTPWDDVRRELTSQLYRIVRDLPGQAVSRLRQSPVWVEATGAPSAMWAHIDPEWLKANGYLPQKVNCIEIRNPDLFVKWCKDQPSMVLHEMAHVYHNKYLHENPELHKAYENAVKCGIYDKVLHINGKTVRAYALTNDTEYFAETAEAFFGTNDMYPFVRAELKVHDPAMFELQKKLWDQSLADPNAVLR